MNLNEITASKAEDHFLFGNCGSFAIALQNVLGGEIYSLVRGGVNLHAFVRVNGQDYDVKGPRGKTAMALSIVGSIEGFSVVGPLASGDLPFRSKPKMIQLATEYIESNKRLFAIQQRVK